MTYLLDIIAGARPNFMKIAPIIHAINKIKENYPIDFKIRLIHTGQHYDSNMSSDFFEQLSIPAPDYNLYAGSGTQSEQTAAIMIGYEKLLLKKRADNCLVVGDVNSTMACAITAKKMNIPVAHVEAGIRSGDITMPEEINRIVTDSITDYFFTTSENAGLNLQKCGITQEKIYFVGNTMIDTLYQNIEKIRKPAFLSKCALDGKRYIILTLHRPANVDNSDVFRSYLLRIGQIFSNFIILFPVHPRTKAKVAQIKDLPDNIFLVEPQPYLEFIYLIKNAYLVITDSGGITEETTVLNIPCMTLRNNTERPETVTLGTNKLIGTNPEDIEPAAKELFSGNWKVGSIPDRWDGKAGERIAKILIENAMSANLLNAEN